MTTEQEREQEKEKQGGLVWKAWVLTLVVVAALRGGSSKPEPEPTTAESRRERDRGTLLGRFLWVEALAIHAWAGTWMVHLYRSEEYTTVQAVALVLLLLGPSVVACGWMLNPWLRSFTGLLR